METLGEKKAQTPCSGKTHRHTPHSLHTPVVLEGEEEDVDKDKAEDEERETEEDEERGEEADECESDSSMPSLEELEEVGQASQTLEELGAGLRRRNPPV